MAFEASISSTPVNSRDGSYDTDGDGIPNAFEAILGTNPSVADDDGDIDMDGYTNIEEFLNMVDVIVGYTVTPVSGLTTTEAGGTDTFDVVLDTEPSSSVVFDITSNDTGEGTVSSSTLTFTTGNWDTPQTITVTGVDDGVDDGNVAYTVTVSVNDASSDDDFDALPDTTVNLTNTDNDEPADPGKILKGNALRINDKYSRIKTN